MAVFSYKISINPIATTVNGFPKNLGPYLKIILISNTAWYLWNFRRGLINTLIQAGGDIYVLVPEDRMIPSLEALGCTTILVSVHGKGINPFEDAGLLFRYMKIFRAIRPDAILTFTIKPVIYAGIAARLMGLPVVQTITGLGTVFIRSTWITQLAKLMYRVALRKAKKVFFQNQEDRVLFEKQRIVSKRLSETVPGSGVDLRRFSLVSVSRERELGEENFLFIGRLLRDKGILELVEATRLVKKTYPNVNVQILGPVWWDNATAIEMNEIEQWADEGIIEYLGETDDVRPFIKQCDCVVLPSYREGIPRVLLEAAAMGRPVIATNVVGCRDVVEDQITGFLCRERDPEDLATKMNQFICLPVLSRQEMGSRGRLRVETKFNEQNVVSRYVDILLALGSKGSLKSADSIG